MSPLQLERRVARKHLAGEYFFQDPKVLFALQRGFVVSCHCLAAHGLVKRDLVNMYIIYICLVQWFLKIVDE